MPRLLIGIVLCAVTTAIGCQTGNVSGLWNKVALKKSKSDTVTDADREADMAVAVARLQESQGNLERAMKAYRDAIELDPERADAHWRLAVLMDRHGSEESSQPHYERAVELAPNNTDLLTDYGYSRYLHGDYQGARSALERALRIDPQHARAHNHLGFVFACLEQTDPAIEHFQASGCSDPETLSNLGLAFAMTGQLEKSRRMYELALEREPTFEVAQLGLDSVNGAMGIQDEPELRGTLVAEAPSSSVDAARARKYATLTGASLADDKPEIRQTHATAGVSPKRTR